MFIRYCPVCNKSLEYVSEDRMLKASTLNKPCRSCSAKNRPKRESKYNDLLNEIIKDYLNNSLTIDEISEKYKIPPTSLHRLLREHNIKNPERLEKFSYNIKDKRFSQCNYENWLHKYGKEEADIRQVKFSIKKSVSSSGKNNPMYGKPAPQGSGCGWKGWYKGRHFRSLRELSYMLQLDEKCIKWETGEQKRFRTSYINYDGSDKTCVPDFFIEDSKIIEVKPKKLHNSPLVKLKTEAISKFCKENGLDFEIIDIEINYLKIKEALDKGFVKFYKNYEKKFLDYQK